jgi:hypothetical protein
MSEEYMEENDIDPGAVACIPPMKCCGLEIWDCECPTTCEECGEVARGQGLCSNCFGLHDCSY